MKILFLLIVIVNIFVALYEFKYDIDYAPSSSVSLKVNLPPDQEKITLVNESTKTQTE